MDPFADSPLVAVRDFPHQAASLYYRRRRGELWSPLPGILALAEAEDCWDLRLASARLWAPDLMICGAAAAKLLWWPELEPEQIDLWGGQRKAPVPWLNVSQAPVPKDLMHVMEEAKVAVPALSAIQTARVLGGIAIDEALRRRAATLQQMNEALGATPRQPGNKSIRRLLRESRNEPWSPLEREAHVRLNKARITGWVTNHKLRIGERTMYVDVALPEFKLAIELDGFEIHSRKQTFHDDRARQNLLVLAGWTVLRYTWETIDDLVPQVRRFLSPR